MLTLWNPRTQLFPWRSDFFSAWADEPASYLPAVDIEETDGGFVLKADLPGVDEKAIEVTVHDGVLTLSGKREESRDEQTEYGHRRERRFGSFARSFRLGDEVSSEGIVASYKNGVLTVTLPKKEESKPRQIPVDVH
jgi:HSP20 family protein